MKLKLEKTKAFWLYIVGGIISASLGGMLMPVWDEGVFFSTWGIKSVNIMISALLLAYILLYLVKRIHRYSGTPAQIVAIVELVLMAVIGGVCTVSAFVDIIKFGDPCQIFGLILWTRGASGVFTGYYCDSSLVKKSEKKEAKAKKKSKSEVTGDEEPKGRVDDFTVWRLTLAILLITTGTYLFILPPFGASHLQWVFSCAIVLVGLFFVVYGVAQKPKRLRVNEISETPANAGAEKCAEAEKEQQGALEEGKVKFNVETSASAMTKTAAYDAVKDDQALAVIENKDEK